MDNLKISVVLSSYNGEKYIMEQMDSLRSQTRKIDEVIISDDCSSDQTAEIVRNYIVKYHLNHWRLIENEENRGWKINFMESFKLAENDLIFPCDQDDIWHPDKVEKMSRIIEKNNKILVLASGYTTFYEDKKMKKNAFVNRRKSVPFIQKASFKKNFFYITRPGCVYGFRRELLQYFQKYAYKDYPHDAFLWRTSALLDGLYFYNQSMIDYRRHEETATGREKKDIKHKLDNMRYYQTVIKNAISFINCETVQNKDEKRAVIHRYEDWSKLRIKLLTEQNPLLWFRLIPYKDCFYSEKTFIADLLMVLGIV